MNIHSKVIPLELLPQGFIEAFTFFGADLSRLLENTGISKEMLTGRGYKISYVQQTQLLSNGIHLCSKPGLGLLVGQYMDWSFNGTVGEIVHCSPSLKDAGAAFLRYILIAQPNYAMFANLPNSYIDTEGLVVSPIRFFVPYDASAELRLFEIEYRLAITLRLCDECGNKSVARPEVYVCLSYPEPKHGELYKHLPCHSVKFDCPESYIASHFSHIIEPFRPLRKNAFERIVARCEQEFANTAIETTTAAKVRWHISGQYSTSPTLDDIAEVLSMSPRALTRRLADEKTSFRQIVHENKMEQVSHHLRSSKLSVEEIASLLGFSNASSLRRAVKNWSGDAVSVVRSQSK
ncbi:AraC family transcriptional regulator [Aurantivibrio infirmus]